MSRIGKIGIKIPEKVDVKIVGDSINVKGPKGTKSMVIPSEVTVERKGDQLVVDVKSNDRKSKSLWGVIRTCLHNAVVGVSTGFKKSLEFNGVGYKAAVSGNTLVLSLGYSHQIDFPLPEGVKAVVNKNVIEIEGNSKEIVGHVSASIRDLRPPEPYKGKGLKYLEEKIIRKAGKTGAKK